MSTSRLTALVAPLLASFTVQVLASDCSSLSADVSLVLRDSVHAARASGTATCYASNGQTNFEATFTGSMKIHQVNPEIDFIMPISATGEWIGTLEAPADYSRKTCYQGFIAVVSGAAGDNRSSSELCTPDPPPPPPPPPPLDGIDGGCVDCDPTGRGYSPIVINFGTGDYRLTGSESPVLFDIRGDGSTMRIGWTAAGADEALLGLDRNGNGTIDSGLELFGNFTLLDNGSAALNGFVALEAYDSNRDDVIDSRDDVWPRLILWRDTNHDGVSQPTEITAAAGSALVAITLDYHWSGRRDSSGNTFRYESAVLIDAGAAHTVFRPVYDVFFAAFE